MSHKQRNETVSPCLSTCLLQISAPLPLDRFFVRFYSEMFLRNSVEKIHILLKSGRNTGPFTWNVFQIVVSVMCNIIQIRQCCVSMTRHSILITLLTVTFVRHHYKGRHCCFSMQSGYANAPQYLRTLSTFLRFFLCHQTFFAIDLSVSEGVV